jgi:beta-glucosidase
VGWRCRVLLASAATGAAVITPTVAPATAGAACPWVGSKAPIEQRAADALAQMTLDEKLAMVHGAFQTTYSGYVPANARLCIPALKLLDGPAGVGKDLSGVTQLPAPVAAAASWDPVVMHVYGSVIAAEAKAKGANVVLGPGLDIVRDPRWGRAWESYGEDPYLTARMGVAHIRGIQSQGVLAQAKHWAIYNQETFRNTPQANAIVDERTAKEIYFPPFEAAVRDAHVASVMCGYSVVNGTFACRHRGLLTDELKTRLRFTGFVTADWFGTHSTVASANAGLDLEMPDDTFFGSALRSAVQAGSVAVSRLDDMVRRILRQQLRFGLFDRPPSGNPAATVTSPARAAIARSTAEQGIVLLKNAAGALPLTTGGVRSIAVLGRGATSPTTTARGSARVLAPYVVTPYAAIARRAGPAVTVRTAADASVPAAVFEAARSDVAVVIADRLATEGSDLGGIELSAEQNELIREVAAVNPRTIVVLTTSSAVTTPWVGQVEGLLAAWYPGQEAGNAIASVLFGDVNPSGKLPVTFPGTFGDLPAAGPETFPGVGGRALYRERLEVGYRHYDAKGITPLFPFGHGLSYTTFRFGPLSVVARPGKPDGRFTASVSVTNTGSRPGAEVVQLYVGHPASAGEPPRQLRRFRKVRLDPRQSQLVRFFLNRRDLAHWSTSTGHWIAPAGAYRVMVGNSSRHLPATATATLPRTLVAG